MEFQHVFPADGDLVVQFFTGTAVIEVGLGVGRKSGCLQGSCQVFIAAAVEDRCCNVDARFCRFRHAVFFKIIAAVNEALLHFFVLGRALSCFQGCADFFAQHMAGPGQMDFQNLADIHSGRYAQGVQYQVHRTAIGSERHIFHRKDSGAYALVAVTAGHLVAFADLTFLGNVDTHQFVHAGSQFVAVFTGEYLHVHHLAEFAMGHAQGCITDFSFLVAEDGTQESFFRSQFGFALRCHLAYQDITGPYIGTYHDNPVFIQIFHSVFGNGRQLAGNFFFAQLGISGIAFVFFNMDGSVEIILAETFGNQYGVFVVVPFPGYEGYQYVVAQSQFALVRCHAVSQGVALFNPFALEYGGALVDAGGLVGTHELNEVIGVKLAIVCADNDLAAGHSFHGAAPLGEDADAGVLACHPFHTGAYERRFRTEQRHSLALHVGTHEGTVRIIVFQEWNEGCTDGDNLLWRYVHQVYFFRFCFQYVGAAAACHILMNEMAFRIQRFRSLGNDLVFFDIGGDILCFVGYVVFLNAGLGIFRLFDNAVRGLDEAVLVDDTVVGQRGNQADVRTFRGFYRAHTAVMGVMYVADFEPCSFTGQAAGAQSGQTALMGQFSQRVCLVHELGQLGGSEEFFDSCHYRADIHQSLGGHLVLVLGSHSFTNHSFHTGEADAELVLQKFAYAANAAVAQMVDIIASAVALHHVQQVIDAGNNVAPFQDTVIIFPVAGRADHLDRCAVILLGHHFHLVEGREHAAFLDTGNSIIINEAVGFNHHFAGFRIHDGAIGLMTAKTVLPGQLLVQLVAAYLGQIVTAGIIEEIVKQRSTGFFRSRFTGAQLVVNFNESGLAVRGIILLQRPFNVDIMIEKIQNFLIGRIAQGTDKNSHRHLAVSVDTNGNGT